jgi:hypothetical protein
MNVFAQVGHLMAKDIREMRWMLAVYAVVVAVATVQATSLDQTTFAFGFAGILVVMVGMVLVASLVQADSPARADAFWAVRPIDPTAVVVAKLGHAAAIVTGVALVGQLVAFMSLGVPRSELPLLLAESATAYAIWLLLAMVVAALTRDLKSAFVAFAVTILAFIVVTAVVPARITAAIGSVVTNRATLALLTTIPLLAAVALLTVLYRVRDPRPRVRFGGAIVVAIIWYAAPSAPPPTARALDAMAAEQPVLDLTVHDLDKIAERQQIWLTLDAPTTPDTLRLSVVNPVVVLRLVNGDTIRLALAPQSAVARLPMPPLARGIRWLSGGSVPRERVPLTVQLRGALRDSVAGGIAGIRLDGRAVLLAPKIAADLPLAEGASITRSGMRIRMEKWTHGHGDVSMTAHAMSIGEASYLGVSGVAPGAYGELQGVLVNRSRGEAALLTQNGSGSGQSMLVLPGVPTGDRTMNYQWDSNGLSGRIPLDDAWLNGARLMVVNWIPIGGYPVRVTVTVP